MVKVNKSPIFFSFISCLLITTPAYANPSVGVWNIVSTLAGNGTAGYAGGSGTSAQFNYPRGVAVDSSGNVYVADTSNHRIRRITPTGTTSVFAGSGTAGTAEGTGASAQFNNPFDVAIDNSGTFYITDHNNFRIRKITSGGTTSLLAGSTSGYVEGTGASAKFIYPWGIALDSSGIVYVADGDGCRIRKITSGGTTSLLAGSGVNGDVEGTGASAQFDYPAGLVVDGSGNVYVTDRDNSRIRKITSGGTTSAFAGNGDYSYAEGTGVSAKFNAPTGITLDSSGTIYVTDTYNHRIRKITPGGTTSLIAGTGAQGYAEGIGASAKFYRPWGIAVDSSGNVYISDTYNHSIRKIDASQIYINTDTYSANSGLITLPGASTYIRMDSDAGGTINNASFALTFGKTDGTTVSSTFRGIIQGTGSLTINADAGKSLTLAGPSTYSGGTTVTSGILILAHNTGAGTNTITYNGGSLQIGANAVNIGNAITLRSSASNSLNLNGFNATLSGAIGGGNSSSTLAVTNSGGAVRTLTLSGANTYTGTTTIGSNVTIALSGTSTLGAAGVTFTDNTSTFDLSATTSGATVTNLQSGGGNIVLGAKTVTLNNTSNTSFGGTISDGGLGGSVTKSGTSILTLTGTNTYRGGTTITAGTVSISAANNLGSSTGGITFNGANTTLTVTSALTLANPITLTTNGTINTQGDVTASGVVSGTGILTKTGANTLTLTGASSFGGTTISGGTVTFSTAANVGTTVSLNGGKLQLASNATGAVTLASPSITASGGTIENLSAQPLTLASLGGGSAGALIKNGSGPLTLSGSSSRSGTTTVNAGALGIDHYQSLGSGSLTLAANTSLELAGNIGSAHPVANAIAITGPITVDSKGYTGYFNGPITGAQPLTVQGSGGTVVVGGTNTPSSTTVTSGTLALLNSSSSFSNPVNVSSGATLDISQGPATPTLANVTTVAGSNIKLGSQALSLTSGTIAGNLLDGGISGTTGATLTKTGGGTLILTGTNTYAGGTSLQAGTININNIHALGTGALNYAIAGATLQIGAALTGAIPNDIILTADGNLDTQGYDVDLGGSVSGSATLHKLGSGILTLSGVNTYNGAQLLDGKVALGNNLGFGGGTVSFNTPGTELRIARTLSNVANPIDFTSDGIIDTFGNDATFSGAFSGAGKFTKNGTGKVRITNPTHPTFSGQMEINDGEVNLNGDMTNAPVVVNSGAKFTGNNTVAHLTNSGTVKPGNSIGVINIAGNFSNAGGVYNCEINATPTSDIINVGGTATLGGTLNILPQPGNYSTPKTYTILTAVNPIVTTFDSVTSPSILLQYTLNYLPNMVQLTASQGTSLSRIITEGNPGIVAQYIDTLSPTAGSALDNFLNVLPSLSLNDIYKGLNQLHPAANVLISSVVAANELNQTDGMFSSLLIERSLRRVRKYTTVDDKQSAQFNFSVTQANAPVVNEGLDSLFFTRPPASAAPLSPLPQPQAAPQNMRTSFGSVNIWFQQAVSNINHRSVSDGSPTIGVPGVKANLNSTSLGADTQITDQLLFGTTVGYSKISYKLRQKYGNGHISSYRFALYGMWTPKKEWYVNASGFYGRHHFKGKRNLVISSSSYRNRQRHLGHHYSGIVEVGRDIALPNQTTLTPYGSVGGLALKEDGYTETEDGFNPSLKVKGRTSGFIQAKAGLQLSSFYKFNDIQLYVYAKLGYIYKNPLRKPQRVTASFVGYNGNFTVFANTKQQNMFNPGLGVTALLTDQLSLTASYTGEISPVQRLHQALIRLDYKF